MAACKDCVHVEICRRMMVEVPEVHEPCYFFKDRSRFVELPPCKEGDSVYSICFCYGEGGEKLC